MLKRFLLVICVAIAASIVALSAPASAQGFPPLPDPESPPLDELVEPGPSTGTLIAAALETVGYKAQSIVLEDLNTMLYGLGRLIYVCCIFSAIFTVALSGRYELALWFLMGPAFFFFIIDNTVEAAGAEWQFGAFKPEDKVYGEGEVNRFLEPFGTEIDANVSWVFHRYNVIISDLVQNLVKVVTNADKDKSLKFVGRGRMLADLFGTDIGHPKLLALVKGNYAQCAPAMNAARQVALGHRDHDFRLTHQWSNAAIDYCRLTFAPGKKIPDISRSYVDDLVETILKKPEEPEEGEKEPVIEATKVYQSCAKRLEKARERAELIGTTVGKLTDLNCMDLWCLSMIGVTETARQAREGSLKANIDTEHADPEMIKEVYQELLVKLSTPAVLLDEDGDVMDETYRDDEARKKVMECKDRDPVGDFEPAEFLIEDAAMIDMIIGGHILRKHLTQDPRSQMISEIADHAGISNAPYNFELNLSAPAKRDIVNRQWQHQLSTSQQYEVFIFAMALPYVQGIILYGLAIIFPFFALLVLVPGKASAFFAWFALWAWAKSWDFGWALVMVIDEILWEMLPHSGAYDPIADQKHGPITVFESAFSGDIAYSLTNYFTLLGILLTAVPYLTGQMILGAKAAVGGIMIDGIKPLGEALSGPAADRVALGQVHDMNRLRENYGINKVRQFALSKVNMLPYMKSAMARLENASSNEERAGIINEMSSKISRANLAGGHGIHGSGGHAALIDGASRGEGENAKESLGANDFLLRGGAYEMASKGAEKGYLSAALGSIAGGNVKAAAASLESAMNSKEQLRTMGIKSQRLYSKTVAEANHINAEMWHSRLAEDDEWRNMEQLRASASLRGEWWIVPDAPVRSDAQVDSFMIDLNIEGEKHVGESVTNQLRVLADTFVSANAGKK